MSLKQLAAQTQGDPTPLVPDPRVEVLVRDGHDHEMNEASAAELLKMPEVYVRSGHLVEVVKAGPGESAPIIADLGRQTLRDLLSQRVVYRRKRDGKKVKVPVPDTILGRLLERRGWPTEARHLVGVTETPSLRPDGSVLSQPGYDPRTGLYLDTTLKLDEEALKAPTREDAVNACEQLLEVVCDFPFDRPEGRSTWLAFVLTIFGRPAIPAQVPLFVADANVAGSGKSRLFDLGAMLATGRELPRSSMPPDEAEWQKRVMAILMASKQMVLLDNLSGELGSDSLDLCLTGPTYSGRVLGTGEDRTLPARTIWTATGNNVQLRGDLRRRVLRMRLDSPVERPEERRDFRHPDLFGWVRENRTRLATAALVLLRAYHLAGRPGQDGVWGSFEAWHRLVRGALVWAGQPDPDMMRNDLAEQSDPTTTAFRSLLVAWHELWGSAELHVSDILKRLTPGHDQELPEGLQRIRSAVIELAPGKDGGLPSAVRFAKSVLTRFRDRPGPDGLRIQVTVDRAGSVWRVTRRAN